MIKETRDNARGLEREIRDHIAYLTRKAWADRRDYNQGRAVYAWNWIDGVNWARYRAERTQILDLRAIVAEQVTA